MKKHNAIIRSASIFTASVLLLGTSFISCKTDEPAPQSIKVGQILITDIDGQNSSTYVEQGDFITLQAQVLPENASDKTIVWETSDSDILSVSQDGKITANTFTENAEEERTATVKALAQDGSNVSAEITVRVLPKTKHVSSINITSKYSDSILKDESTTLTIKVLPEDAADKTFKITSSDPNILSITKDEDENYLATGNAKGEAKIIVTANDRYQNTRKTAEYTIKVLGEKIDLNEISLAASNLVIESENVVFTNQTSKISLIKTPEDATLSRENGIIFSITQGDDIAEIADDGTVTFGENAGQVTINATATDRSGNTKEASLTFTVRKPVSQIKITKPENVKTETDSENNEIILLPRDDDDETEETDNILNLGANITPDDASVKTLIWESSDSSIAEVNENGTVSAKAAGNVTITAKSTDESNISAAQKISVFIPVNKVNISATKTEGFAKTNLTLSVTVEPEDADDSVTYEIIEGEAEVSEDGVVSLGDVAGTVIVKATSKINNAKSATIKLTSVLNKTELQSAIKAATEKLTEVGTNISDDVTEIGKYLTANKTAVETAKTLAENLNANANAKQSEIDNATNTLNEAIAACKPTAITPAKDIIIENTDYVLFASSTNTDGLIAQNVNGLPELPLPEDSIFENYETTETNLSVKHVKATSPFSVQFKIEKNASPVDGKNNKFHISLFTSKIVRFGIAIWEPTEINGNRVLPSFSFDPTTGKVFADVRVAETGAITDEIEVIEVGSGTKTTDNWWSIDFKWSEIYEKQPMDKNAYAFVFYPIDEETASEFFFDNFYAYKADKTEAELLVAKKNELSKAITKALTLHDSAVEGEQLGQYQDGSKEIFKTAIDEAQNIFNSTNADIEDISTAISALAEAQSVFASSVSGTSPWEITVTWLKTSQCKIEFSWTEEQYALALDTNVPAVSDQAHPTVQSVLAANKSGSGTADNITATVNENTLTYGINIWYWDQYLGGNDTFIIYLKDVGGKDYTLRQAFHMENNLEGEGQNTYIADGPWLISLN